MSSTFHDAMWAEASRDHAAESAERSVALSSVALAGLVPFLHAASSTAEYDERLALVAERAAELMAAHTPDTRAHEAALAQVRSDFEALHTTRVAARLTAAMAAEARKPAEATARCAACNERLEKVDGNWRHTEYYAGAGKGFNRSHEAHPAKGSTKTAAASSWDEVKPGDRIRVGHEDNATDGIFVRLEKKDDDDPIYKGQRFVVYKTSPDGPELKAGLTSYQGQEEKPRPAREASLKTAGASSDLDDMIAWEEGRLDEDSTVALFQRLIDTGWLLQGAYARQAQALLDAGLCHQPGREASLKTAAEGDYPGFIFNSTGGNGRINGSLAVKVGSIDLKNVGIVDRAGLVCKGVDPSGKEVKFKVTQSEMNQLAAVLFGDLATNFSGVTIEDSDIVKDASAKTAADENKPDDAKGEKCWDCGGTGKVPDMGGGEDGYEDCPTCGGSGYLSKTGVRVAVVPPFGGEVVTASFDDLIAGLSEQDVLEAEALLEAEGISLWGHPGETAQERWEKHHADPEQHAKDVAQQERYERSVAERTAQTEPKVAAEGDLSEFILDEMARGMIHVPEHGFMPSHNAPDRCSECGRKAKGHEVPKHLRDASLVRTADSAYRTDYRPGSACPYCGADSSKVSQTAKAGSPLTGVDRYKCEECSGTMSDNSSRKTSSMVHTSTVKCAKCTAGSTPDGADCGYCDGVGSLDPTMAMIKSADGWDQGITAQSFLVAVNSDAEGSDRYQKTTHPKDGQWADTDEWEDGKADRKTLDTGRAGKDRGIADKDDTTDDNRKASSLRTEADLKALVDRLQRISGNMVDLTYTSDFGVNTVHGTLNFQDGNAQVVSLNGAVHSIPAYNVLSVERSGIGSNDAPLPTDREPGILDWIGVGIGNGLVPSGATGARKVANPYASNPYDVDGPGSANANNVTPAPPTPAVTEPPVDPQTTRPRVAPQSNGYDPEQYPSTSETPTHGVGPVDRSADTVVVEDHTAGPSNRAAAMQRANRAFTAPPVRSAREAKIGAITASVLTSNPGMDVDTARKVAEATIDRYAGVARS